MTTATVLEFMHRTADDETLRQQLEALLGVGDGNISSETELDPDETAALTGDRAPVVAAFAAQHGFQFSADELITVVNTFQQHQAGTLSDDEFGRILGTSFTDSSAQAQSQVKRLVKFLSKTYLGIDLA
ncbi:MAG: hypothetical protein Fur0046_17400 [Cyanobacteria bacterium J069]|nr:MAG: hypothetical protein D6742_07580 [Cyanobacteria bacterium J069]